MEYSSTIVLSFLFAFFLLFYWFSGQVRFWTKVIFFWVYGILLVPTLHIPLALMRPKDIRNNWFPMAAARLLSPLYGIKYKLRGLENLTKEHPVVIVCNHQSELDLIAMGMIWPHLRPTAVTMKKEILYSGPIGLASYLSGSIYLDRGNTAKAKATMNNVTSHLTHKKISIWTFPEGTINEFENLLPFKKGAFHMAVNAQVPILPIVVSSYSGFFRSLYGGGTPKFENGGQVTIQILPPVPTDGMNVDDVVTLAASVRDSMQETFNSISGFNRNGSNNKNTSQRAT